jgi:1-aminocyclopropane-1-carboxylate synthase
MGGPRFSAAMASHINDHFSPNSPVQPTDILTAGGLTSIHSLTGWSLGDVGNGILVARPVYGRFELDFGNTGGLEIVYASMHGVDPFEVDVVERYQITFDEAKKRGVEVKAVMIVNPHNPLGRCFKKDTLVAIMKFAQRNGIHLISDEVYALSVYDTGFEETVPFTSVLSIDPKGLIDTDRLHVFYGMSKVISLSQTGLLRQADRHRISHPASDLEVLSRRTRPFRNRYQQTFASTTHPVCPRQSDPQS